MARFSACALSQHSVHRPLLRFAALSGAAAATFSRLECKHEIQTQTHRAALSAEFSHGFCRVSCCCLQGAKTKANRSSYNKGFVCFRQQRRLHTACRKEISCATLRFRCCTNSIAISLKEAEYFPMLFSTHPITPKLFFSYFKCLLTNKIKSFQLRLILFIYI